MRKICDAAAGLKFFAENSLEEYRAESILTKEPETIAWIDEFKVGDVFLDVGANVGVYSCYAAHRDPNGRVYAAEPVLRNFVRLTENVELNGLRNVVPLLLAFSDRSGIESLFVRDDRTGGSGSQIGHSHDEHGKPFEALHADPTVVFAPDHFFEAVALPLPQHVKIDVDGNEAAILRGMARILQADELRSILIEMNAADDDARVLIGEIESCGFTRENQFNRLDNHSRNRRRLSAGNLAENVIFTRV